MIKFYTSPTLYTTQLNLKPDNKKPGFFYPFLSFFMKKNFSILLLTCLLFFGGNAIGQSGVNTYSGNTTISSGTLALSGSGSIANSPTITVGSGATFNVTALTTALSLGASQKLSGSATGSNTTGTITVTNTRGITLSAGGLAFTAYGGGSTAPLTVTGASAGALALNSAPVTVTTTTALAAGTYTLIAKGGSATGVTGTPGTLTVNGSGLAAGTIGTLSVVSGQLILTVAPTYTVTYDGNLNDGGTVPTDGSSPYVSGTLVTVLGPGSMTKSGFIFGGWDTNNDGIKDYDGTGLETFLISANTTLKAVWNSSSSPILAITGTPTNHSPVCPTFSGTPITYTITNSGSVAALGVVVTSSDNTQFEVSGLSSTTIAASGGTATYQVTFKPSSAGAKSATITVTSTTSGSNSPTSSLTGTGTATVAQAVTTSAAGSVSYSSATLNGNVTNTGTCPTAIEKGFVYSITSVNAAPAVGGTGVIKIAVGSIGTGTYNTGLTGLPSSTQYSFTAYVFDGTTYTYGSTLTFTTFNALTISGTLAHGSVCPGSSASPITYTITNNSISTVTGVAVGSSNSEFNVSGLSPTSIAAGATATYQVTFTPSASGGRSAIITVTSSAASVNNTVTGTGTATVAQAVSTTSSSAITTSTATVTGNVTTLGVCPASTEKGFVYSVTATNATPTVSGTGVTKVPVGSISTGTYNTGLTSLSSSTQYSFRAYVYDGTTYTYGTTLTFTTVAPPPANDDCSNAIPITIGAAAVSGTLVSSTYTTNTFAYAPTKRDVWYSFTPLCTGNHTVTLTFTTGPDIDLDVFSTGACPTTGTAGGTSHGTTTTESVTASYTGGTTYYIRVIDYNTTATTFNIGITSAALPQLTLSNTGTPAIGNISPSTTDVPLYGFSLAPNACVTTYDFTGITVTKTGTTTTSDLSNFRIFYDANNNGIVDGGESSVSGAGIALSASMAFTITGQTGLSATRRYLLVADVAAGATNGNTFTGSAATAGITSSISVTGTAAGNQQTVVVIKAEPTNYPTSFNCGTTTATTIQLTWTDASAGVLPDGYLIKWSSVSYAAILDPADGTAVANGAGVQNVAQGTGNYTVTSLTAGTTYYFKIWSYSNSGTNINYKLTSEPQTSCNTISASSDIINDVTYSLVPSTNFDYKSWQSASQTSASDGLGMFNIIIRDGGASSPDADGLPTILNAISFSCPTFANIRSAALFTTTGTLVQSVTVSSSTITFSGLSGVNVTAPDNGTIELILRLSFKNTPATITDNTKIVFTVSSATAASSASSSQFINATAGGAISDNDGDNENRLEVTADRLAFVQQPSDATTGATMTPAVTVRGNDINAIQDLDFTASISLACSTPAALTSGGGPVSTSAGVATFGSIVHGTNGTYTMSANASGLISGVSNSYTISTFTYLPGDFRPLYTSDLSYNGTWEYNTGSGWITSAGGSWDGKAPQNTTSSIGRVIINDYVTGGGSATKAYNCDFIILNGGELVLLENDAPPVAAEMIAAGKKLEVFNGGILTIEGDIDLASSGNLIVRSGGTMTINQNSVRNDHPMWDGVELFEGGSTVTIKNWDWTGSSTNWSIFNNNTSISFNANGWKFGNLILDVNNSIQNWQIVGGNLGGVINLCENDLDISNAGTSYTTGASNRSGTNGFVVNGNMTIYDGNFSFGSSYTADPFNHQFVVNGDFNCISNDALKLHLNGAGTATALTGNVSVKGDFIVGNTVTSFTNDKATDNSVLPLNLSGNGTTQLLTVYPTAVAIPMNVKSNAYVQLSNTDLVVNSSSGVTADFKVEANATLDFNFNVTTPLVIKKVTSGGAGTNSFTSIQGCTLKITAPDGINLASGATGATGQALNVQMTTANTISALATFWYMGKTNQHTGTGIGTASNGRALIVDLSDNIYSLTPDVAFGITGTTNTYINSGNGGILDIRKGQFIETVNEYITGSDGALKMGNGTLYKIVKGYSAALATGAEPATPNNFIPRLTGTYTLNGGIIELGGNSTGNYFQALRGGKTYYSIKFSGSNTYTYPTDASYTYKNLTSNVTINDSLYISETAVVDCIDRAGDAASFTGNGGLVMDGGRMRIKNSSSTQPELVGDNTAYILTGGTVEFYGTSAIQQQQMRGNYTSSGTKPKVNYYNVDINADASNYSTVAGAGNVDLNSSFTLSGTMNVNSLAVLRMDKMKA
jgi:hypothetical protein